MEVRTRPDPIRSCELAVSMGASAWDTQVDSVPGDPGQPMQEMAVTAKFLTYTMPAIGAGRATRLVDRLLHGPADAILTLD